VVFGPILLLLHGRGVFGLVENSTRLLVLPAVPAARSLIAHPILEGEGCALLGDILFAQGRFEDRLHGLLGFVGEHPIVAGRVLLGDLEQGDQSRLGDLLLVQ
jgi:hypothetical protein